MTKTTIVAVIAALGLSVPASAHNLSAISKNASTTVSGVFAPSINVIMKGVNSLLDSTAREVSQDAVALSFNASKTAYNSTVKVSRGTWTLSTNTSAAIVTPIWEVSKTSAKSTSAATSAIYKKVAGFSVNASTATVESGKMIAGVASEYGAASGQAASFAWNSTKTGLSIAANSARKAVVVTVNGSKAVATWSSAQVVKASAVSKVSGQNTSKLTAMVSDRFVNALKSTVAAGSDVAEASADLLIDTAGDLSGLTVSIVKASAQAAGSAYAGSKAVAGGMWVVVTAGSTDSYGKFSNGEYSAASEVLLMLPLQSVKGASAVSTSTKKDDELGEGDIPDTKKGK